MLKSELVIGTDCALTGYGNICTPSRPLNGKRRPTCAAHTTENRVLGLKRSKGRITYKEIWMVPRSLYPLLFSDKMYRNTKSVKRNNCTPNEIHNRLSANSITGTVLGKGIHTSPNDQTYEHSSPELPALIERGKSYGKLATYFLLPPCQTSFWIPTSPFLSQLYFLYFSCLYSDLPAPSTVCLFSLPSFTSFHVSSLAPESSCRAARSLVQWHNSADLPFLKQCLLSRKSPSKPSLWNGLVH